MTQSDNKAAENKGEAENPLGPPPWLNAPPVGRYPYEDTHDLRSGPDLHPALLGLLPFVGLWRGRGQGGFPADEDYDFAQEVRISHDGRPFLRFESRSWRLGPESEPLGEWITESGFWRPVLADGRATDEMEATMITPDGTAEIYVGKTIGTTRLEMEADAIAYTPDGLHLTGGHRLFGIVDGALLYAHEQAVDDSGLKPHMSARLLRIGG